MTEYYRLVDHWVPRNILRVRPQPPVDAPPAPQAAAAEPAKPRFPEDLWRLTLDKFLVALKPFEAAWNAVQAAVRRLLEEVQRA